MEQITKNVLAALASAGIPAAEQFPAGVMPRLTAAKAAVELRGLRAAAGSFLDYLGVTQDPEKGPLERYGRRMQGTVRVRILAPDADLLRSAADRAAQALLFGVQDVTAEEVSMEECVFDPKADCFRKDVFLQFGAYFVAQTADEDAEFLDFKLEGEIR